MVKELRRLGEEVIGVENDDQAPFLEEISTAFSTTALSAPSVAAAATRAPIDHSFYVDEGEELMVAMTTVKPGAALGSCTVAQLERNLDLSIILHKRGVSLQRGPHPDTILRGDDRLVVFAASDTLARLGQMRAPCEVPEAPEPGERRSWLARLCGR